MVGKLGLIPVQIRFAMIMTFKANNLFVKKLQISTLSLMKTYIFLLVLSISVFANAGEVERIQSHLKLVESLLRLQDTSHLDDNQLHNRKRNLDVLNNYWQRGEFPQNISRPNSRHPFFIDHHGVPCAVGYLIIKSGHPELAQRISLTQNELF